MKAIELYFRVVLFIMFYKVVASYYGGINTKYFFMI